MARSQDYSGHTPPGPQNANSQIMIRTLLLLIFFPVSIWANTYVIGDLHGDLEAFLLMTKRWGLVDAQGNWAGGDNQLVLMGDLVDRGPETKALMDQVMKLEKQAPSAGGQIHTLLGNHEFLLTEGELTFTHQNDSMAFKKTPRESGSQALMNAYQGDSPYAQWIRTRPTMLILDGSLFVHAGVEQWALHYSVEEINSMVQEWFRFGQGVGPEPSPETRWVVAGSGPLWTRALSADLDSVKKMKNSKILSETVLHQILEKLNVKRVFIGHSLVRDFEKTVNHPNYGPHVIMTDTDISSAQSHIISGFRIDGDTVEAHWFQRNSGQIYRRVQSPPLKKFDPRCKSAW